MPALSQLVPVLTRFDRPRVDGDLAAGAATLQTKALPRQFLARLELVVVSGDGIGGARVNLYASEDLATAGAAGNIIGTVELGASDPCASFGGGDRPWLYGGEVLTATIAGASGTGRVSMKVWQRLYVLDARESDDPAPVQIVGPVELAAHAREGGA